MATCFDCTRNKKAVETVLRSILDLYGLSNTFNLQNLNTLLSCIPLYLITVQTMCLYVCYIYVLHPG